MVGLMPWYLWGSLFVVIIGSIHLLVYRLPTWICFCCLSIACVSWLGFCADVPDLIDREIIVGITRYIEDDD